MFPTQDQYKISATPTSFQLLKFLSLNVQTINARYANIIAILTREGFAPNVHPLYLSLEGDASVGTGLLIHMSSAMTGMIEVMTDV